MVLLRLQFSGEWTANRRQSHHGKPQPAERTLIVAPACESYGKFHRHFKRSQKREKSVHCQRVKRIYKSMKWSTGGMCSSDSCTRPKWWTAKTNWELYYVIAATRERFNLQTSHRNCDEVFVRVQLHACGDKLPCGIAIAFQIDHHSTRTTFNCDIWFSWFSFSAEKINETASAVQKPHMDVTTIRLLQAMASVCRELAESVNVRQAQFWFIKINFDMTRWRSATTHHEPYKNCESALESSWWTNDGARKIR